LVGPLRRWPCLNTYCRRAVLSCECILLFNVDPFTELELMVDPDWSNTGPCRGQVLNSLYIKVPRFWAPTNRARPWPGQTTPTVWDRRRLAVLNPVIGRVLAVYSRSNQGRNLRNGSRRRTPHYFMIMFF
jgi:hypothetical protein